MAEPAVTTTAGAASGQDRTLARSLTAPGLVAIGLGATIGAGIFVLTGTAAAQYAGPR